MHLLLKWIIRLPFSLTAGFILWLPCFKNEEKEQEAKFSLTNTNLCFMANNDEVTIDDCVNLEVEEAYIELLMTTKSFQKGSFL